MVRIARLSLMAGLLAVGLLAYVVPAAAEEVCYADERGAFCAAEPVPPMFELPEPFATAFCLTHNTRV